MHALVCICGSLPYLVDTGCCQSQGLTFKQLPGGIATGSQFQRETSSDRRVQDQRKEPSFLILSFRQLSNEKAVHCLIVLGIRVRKTTADGKFRNTIKGFTY